RSSITRHKVLRKFAELPRVAVAVRSALSVAAAPRRRGRVRPHAGPGVGRALLLLDLRQRRPVGVINGLLLGPLLRSQLLRFLLEREAWRRHLSGRRRR